METECEVGVDPLLQREQPLFLEPGAVRACERVVEIAERRPAPERERFPHRLRGAGAVAAVDFAEQLLEAIEVELARLDPHEVARGLRHDPLAPERLAEAGDVDLQRRASGLGRSRVPKLVDQAVAGDNPVGLEQEEREQRTLLDAAEGELPAVVGDLERPEDPKLHASPPLAAL